MHNLNREKIVEGARQELARRHYVDYVEYVHNGFYKHARHTKYLCDRLDRLTYETNQRIIIDMPPRHSKSMTVTEAYPSWYLNKNQAKRVIVVAYGHDLAEGFGRKNREKIREHGSVLFNSNLSSSKATASDWELSNNLGGLIAAGIGGTITGKGADLLIIDDPIKNMQEALSETYRNRVWDEWQGTLATRLQAGANVILIMTRWHEDDLASRLIKKGGWEVISFPALAESEDILGRNEGEALWPEIGYDFEWALEKKKAVGSRVWASLYQQNPTPADGNIFKKQWFKYYRYKDRPTLKNELVSWDLTFKKNKTTDFVVGQAWGEDEARSYLTGQWRDRATFTESVEAIKTMKKIYPNAKSTLIEAKANGDAVIDTLEKSIPGIIPVNPGESKEARAHAITPFFEAGNVWFPHPDEEPWVEDLVKELLAFPNGAHDDQVDALTQALARIYLKKKPKLKTFKGGL